MRDTQLFRVRSTQLQSGKYAKPFQNTKRYHNFKRSSTLKDFGQQEFIKKLHLNNTKKIDKKSAKAIQKYIHQLTSPKLAYTINPLMRENNQQHQQHRPLTLQHKISPDKDHIYNVAENEESQQLFSPILQYRAKKNVQPNSKGNTEWEKNGFFPSETSIIQRKQKHINSDKNLSFRDHQAFSSQNICSQLKNDSRQIRPTIDTVQKSQSKIPFCSWNSQALNVEIQRLATQNQEQRQIINLQQIMIQKLNLQIEKANQKIFSLQLSFKNQLNISLEQIASLNSSQVVPLSSNQEQNQCFSRQHQNDRKIGNEKIGEDIQLEQKLLEINLQSQFDKIASVLKETILQMQLVQKEHKQSFRNKQQSFMSFLKKTEIQPLYCQDQIQEIFQKQLANYQRYQIQSCKEKQHKQRSSQIYKHQKQIQYSSIM